MNESNDELSKAPKDTKQSLRQSNEELSKAPKDTKQSLNKTPEAHGGGGSGHCCQENLLLASGTITKAESEPATVDYVYGIRSLEGGRVSDYYWNQLNLKVGDRCIAENEYGLFLGTVEFTRHPITAVACKKKRIGKVIRLARDADLEKSKSLLKKEKTARAFCREKIYDRELPMSLTRVHYAFDGAKAIFFFTAESRVDFRELVKDLVSYTRVKVEMRQIGVRDEARMLGGCGPCGTELCCSSFMSDFLPVSIKMAKNQNLSLNPAKISGVCGRLMCCLAFENAHYAELQKHSPKMGKSVTTPDGSVGRVCHLNLIKEKATVLFNDDSKQEFSTRELTRNIGGLPSTSAPKPKPAVLPAPNRESGGSATGERHGRRDERSGRKDERPGRRDETKDKDRSEQAAKEGGDTKKRRRRRRKKRTPGASEESRSSGVERTPSRDRTRSPEKPEQQKPASGDSGSEASPRARRRTPRSRDRSKKRRREPGSGEGEGK